MTPITEFVAAHQDIFFNKIPYMIFLGVLLLGALLVVVEVIFINGCKQVDSTGVLANIGGGILSVWVWVFYIMFLFILFWAAWEALIFVGDAVQIINELR